MSDVEDPSASTATYDQPITLQDDTLEPPAEHSTSQDLTSDLESRTISPTVTGDSGRGKSTTSLARKWTLREELARRKYAKWQGRRPQESADLESGGAEEGGDDAPCGREGSGASASRARARRARPRHSSDARKLHVPDQEDGTSEEEGHYEVDILYENQRGSFLCGIPLFSHRSLLNLDPSPWSNAAFRDSPVDITNAQPPDPTWDWAWKSWYVDMSADVDEEGWQYSFAFSPSFSWHGTHPWFHSFVRRRRWLRKRVKRPLPDDDSQMPGSEYFTMPSARDHSRASSQTRAHARRGHLSVDPELDPRDIHDFGSLMAALKSGRIDRLKLEAVSMFLENGGEELSCLAEHMQEIMSSFIFQASRRQLLAQLRQVFMASQRLKRPPDHEGHAQETEQRRLEHLLHAVEAADEQIRGLEYWSDVKVMAQKGETKGARHLPSSSGIHMLGADSPHPSRVTSRSSSSSSSSSSGIHEEGEEEG